MICEISKTNRAIFSRNDLFVWIAGKTQNGKLLHASPAIVLTLISNKEYEESNGRHVMAKAVPDSGVRVFPHATALADG